MCPWGVASAGTAISSLIRVATSTSPQRRRSMASSRPSCRADCAGPGSAGVSSPGAGAVGPGSASTGRQATGSVKLLRYWIQSQTTRSRARSAVLALRALKTGPSAAGRSTAPGPRSFATGRTSICMVAPACPGDAGAGRPRGGRLCRPGPVPCRPGEARTRENLGDALLEARRHDVDAADPRDPQDLLDDLRAHRHSLVGHPVGRNAAQPAADLVGDPQARDVAAHELQRPQGANWPDPGQDLAALVQPAVPD